MRDELRDGGDASLAWRLLFGLASGEPGTGEELGDAVGGPASGDLVDGVDEVNVGVDAGKLAVEQDGEHVRVALASVEAADEQRVLPERGHDAQQALDVGVGDREPAIGGLPMPFCLGLVCYVQPRTFQESGRATFGVDDATGVNPDA